MSWAGLWCDVQCTSRSHHCKSWYVLWERAKGCFYQLDVYRSAPSYCSQLTLTLLSLDPYQQLVPHLTRLIWHPPAVSHSAKLQQGMQQLTASCLTPGLRECGDILHGNIIIQITLHYTPSNQRLRYQTRDSLLLHFHYHETDRESQWHPGYSVTIPIDWEWNMRHTDKIMK